MSEVRRSYAPWTSRALGFFVDWLPAGILVWVATQFFFYGNLQTAPGMISGVEFDSVTSAAASPVYYLIVLLAIAYWLGNKGWLEGTTGQSLGKRITKRSTIGQISGEPVGAGRGIVRAILVWIEFALILFGVGIVLWLWPAWDTKRQSLLSDKLTGTVVI